MPCCLQSAPYLPEARSVHASDEARYALLCGAMAAQNEAEFVWSLERRVTARCIEWTTIAAGIVVVSLPIAMLAGDHNAKSCLLADCVRRMDKTRNVINGRESSTSHIDALICLHLPSRVDIEASDALASSSRAPAVEYLLC